MSRPLFSIRAVLPANHGDVAFQYCPIYRPARKRLRLRAAGRRAGPQRVIGKGEPKNRRHRRPAGFLRPQTPPSVGSFQQPFTEMAADDGSFAVIRFFMALLSFVGFDTPSLAAQGQQRLPPNFQQRPGHPQGGSGRAMVPLVKQRNGCGFVDTPPGPRPQPTPSAKEAV